MRKSIHYIISNKKTFKKYLQAKDIGMTIRKGIVVSFLPCLVAFWGFHPYMFFHFFKCFFVT